MELIPVEKPNMDKVDTYEEMTEIYNYITIVNDMLPADNFFIDFLRKYPKTNIFKVGNFKNRLDLISKEIYGTPHFWWLIAFMNDIIDPDNFDLKEVKYIAPTNLYDILLEFRKFGGNYVTPEEKDLIG